MPKITSSTCKDFLADFFKNNPQIIKALFSSSTDREISEIQNCAEDSKQWKRTHRCRPGAGDYEIWRSYNIYIDGGKVNRYCEPVPDLERPIDDFVLERGFRLDPTEDAVKFMVLEDKEGNLHLGNYIGD